MSRHIDTKEGSEFSSNRFTITDYAYGGDGIEEESNIQSSSSRNLTNPPRAIVTGGPRHPLEAGPSARRNINLSRGDSEMSNTTSTSSGIRPLPRIPTNPTSPTSPLSPVAGPSSHIVTSPTTLSSSHSCVRESPISPSTSSATYHTPPSTARTLSDRKGKQPEGVGFTNATGTKTRPGRNGSGGSDQCKLQLHEPEPAYIIDRDPGPITPPATSRVSTEIDPLPSVHHQSIYSSHLHERDWDDKDRDEKDIYAAPTINRNQSEKKQVGFWRRITPSSSICRILLAVVIIESLVDLAILANILWRFNHAVKSDQSSELIWQNKRRLPVYLIIFGLAHLWQTILTCIAIKGKNTMQVVALTMFNYAFLAYAVMMQIYELRKILGDLNTSLRDIDPDAPPDEIFTIPLNVLTGVLIGVVATGCVVLTLLAYFVRREFGWQKYRFLGADLQIRKLYQRFQVFECICYFAAFFCCGFGIQFIWLVLQKTDVEYIITWIMFPLLLLLLVFGRFAAIYEKKWMMFTFLFGILCGLAYFTFKLVRIWQQSDTVYSNLSLSLTVFDALSIVSLAACGIWAIWVGSGFGQGLKHAIVPTGSITSAMRIWRTESVETDVEMNEKEKEAQVIAQRRISID